MYLCTCIDYRRKTLSIDLDETEVDRETTIERRESSMLAGSESVW